MTVRAAQVAQALEQALGAEKVISDPAVLAAYRGIAWGEPYAKMPLALPPAPAMVAVRPSTTEDVVRVIRVARELSAPIVPHGAGTGVHAGAAPIEGAILLDIGAMQRILNISRADRMATVQPGVVLGALDAAAEPHHLFCGHDPWSKSIASVGGATSTNGVGYLAGTYGSMGDQVLGLEVVLGTGQVVRTRAVPKSSTGPQLRHLFIGAEGVLGVITEVSLRLFPIPERRELLGYLFTPFERGLDAVLEMFDIGLRPTMIDYEESADQSMALIPGQLVPQPSEMYLAFEGFREQVEAQARRAQLICDEHGGVEMHDGGAQRFWDTRHDSAFRWARQREEDPESLRYRNARRTTTTYINVTLAPSMIQPYRLRAAQELAPLGLALTSSGIWGIPELFSVKFQHVHPQDPLAPDQVEEGMDLGLQIAHELGGSMEYCHGVGLRLAHMMGSELGEGLEVLRSLKRALDPDGLLNPGKLAL